MHGLPLPVACVNLWSSDVPWSQNTHAVYANMNHLHSFDSTDSSSSIVGRIYCRPFLFGHAIFIIRLLLVTQNILNNIILKTDICFKPPQLWTSTLLLYFLSDYITTFNVPLLCLMLWTHVNTCFVNVYALWSIWNNILFFCILKTWKIGQ